MSVLDDMAPDEATGVHDQLQHDLISPLTTLSHDVPAEEADRSSIRTDELKDSGD